MKISVDRKVTCKLESSALQSLLVMFSLTLFFSACSTFHQPYIADKVSSPIAQLPDSDLEHRLYLVGDAGGLDDKKKKANHVFSFVKNRLDSDDVEASVIYLGDNVYNNGLGKKDDPARAYHEDILRAHLDVVKENEAVAYFIPGNHDWNHSQEGGLKATLRQEKFIKKNRSSKKKAKFYPKNGCGDPEVVKVNKDLVYIFLDTQWWVHDWSLESGINKGCEVKSRREFLDRIKDLIIEYKNDKVVLVMHHPMVSNGSHGGHFSMQDHLFPLTRQSSSLYVPVPFIGSIYPIARQLGISPQDNTHGLFRELHEHLESVIRTYDAARVMFVSGHDHILQHSEEQFIFQKFPIDYIISGSGYKKESAAQGLKANFVYAHRGYGILNFYKDGSTWLEFYAVDDDGAEEKLAYRYELHPSRPGAKDFKVSDTESKVEETITAAPNDKFGKGPIFRFLLGDQYREAWTTEVESEVFGLSKYYGGVTPVKKGGGLFSRTLRLEDDNGHQYAMRSMNKDFFKAVPEDLQHLEIMKLYSDQNTASIPYGALYIAELSKYAGVYHTEPQMVYLEHTEELGPFKPYFPKGHYILESRPSGDWSDSELFGSSEEILGYNDLLFKLRKNSTHLVDQRWVLKSRLFDILIHDRDRHDDQWRWASFKDDDLTIYRPIPRDRDWAFFKYGGLIPSLIGNVVDKKLKSFSGKKLDVKSLATNANHFDRYFLNELTWEDWAVEIKKMQTAMTDEAFINSLDALPAESRDYLKDELVDKLISRRGMLLEEVRKYYEFISEEVEVTGTDEKDIFELKVLANGDVHLQVFRNSKKHGKVKRYDRILNSGITNELRIYGLAGKDQFNIDASHKTDIKIRVIGGIGDDEINVNSTPSTKNNIDIYDDPKGMDINDVSLINDHRDNNIQSNEYKRRGYQYNGFLPWPVISYSPDDRFMFGLGFSSIRHAWRKDPFSSRHQFSLAYTPARGSAIDLSYEGEWTDAIGKGWNFNPELFIEPPFYLNYFGPDNNDIKADDEEYNWVRRSSWSFRPNITARRQNNRIVFKIGPSYESHELLPEPDRILAAGTEFESDDFDRKHFVGLETHISLHTLDRAVHPSRGFNVNAFVKQQYELAEKNNTVLFGGQVSFFVPLSVDQNFVFGSNSGYQRIVGETIFYQEPSLGSLNYFRPARQNRYRGEAILYQQFDLRLKLFNWNNSILPFTVGGIGGYDFAQFYTDGVDNGSFKHGWTAGLSFDLLESAIIRASISSGSEGRYFVFGTGFSF